MGVQVEGCSMPRERGMSPFSSPRGGEVHEPVEVEPLEGGESERFPSPRGVELHKPKAQEDSLERRIVAFPSPRGVELHKPLSIPPSPLLSSSFRPLAGLSCINQVYHRLFIW